MNISSESEDFIRQYRANLSNYERLKDACVEAVAELIKTHKIDTLSIYGRVKSEESLLEKCNKKKYENPIQEITDLVGIRVILYYSSDIENVLSIIDKEFSVIESLDKSSALKDHEFGYRSFHKIARIKKEWCATPNYRGLDDFKFEIQIRTVLMHAWAEIEHKLQYKNKQSVPSQFRRKLFLLSAKFEDADYQFDELRDSIKEYSKEAENINDFSKDQIEINLQTLTIYLEKKYPDRAKIGHALAANPVSDLVSQLSNSKYNKFSLLDDILKKTEVAFLKFEQDHFEDNSSENDSQKSYFGPIAVVRISLNLYDKTFSPDASSSTTREKYQKYIKY